LVDRVDGKIQAFPWTQWQREFEIAHSLKFDLMEWTLDEDQINENPLMCHSGRDRIRYLCDCFQVDILSLTGDFFMQAPFFKVSGEMRLKRIRTLRSVVNACSEIGIVLIVLPLVDGGSIQNNSEEDLLVDILLSLDDVLRQKKMKLIFESDYAPMKLAKFISRFPASTFGINFDIGNSAANGFLPEDEILSYGSRIDNVHIKDRELSGSTVPLGEGNANFEAVFNCLKAVNYSGNFILQTARAIDNDHAGTLNRYRTMTHAWWSNSYES
jgi:L-ribulose-5-phosphate 3-epimerase